MEAIKDFHRTYGGLKVELSPSRGKLLLSLLNQRERLERDLLTNASVFRLLWSHLTLVVYESIAFMFHKRLLLLERYVQGVDAAHGFDISPEGKHLFLLLPLNKERPNMAVKTDCGIGGVSPASPPRAAAPYL
jgi:hypothetical protein